MLILLRLHHFFKQVWGLIWATKNQKDPECERNGGNAICAFIVAAVCLACSVQLAYSSKSTCEWSVAQQQAHVSYLSNLLSFLRNYTFFTFFLHPFMSYASKFGSFNFRIRSFSLEGSTEEKIFFSAQKISTQQTIARSFLSSISQTGRIVTEICIDLFLWWWAWERIPLFAT